MNIHPLRQERERRGWSQAKVAEALGVTNRTVSRWEQAIAIPYPYYREQLCKLFEKSVKELGFIQQAEEEAHLILQAPAASSASTKQALYDPTVPEAQGSARRLLGRESLLIALKQRLLAGENLALTALGGLPGVGKTALAVALVADEQVQEHFHDGILWAGLGPQPTILNQLVHWGTLLEVLPPERGRAAPREEWSQALHAAIGERRMLLVIDDAWEAESALAMQIGGRRSSYLLTTRLPQVAFAFAQQGAITVPELAEADGLALLERAVPYLVAQEPEQARALVRAVGGLPLALTLLGDALAIQAFTGQPRRVQAALVRLQEAEQRLRLSMPIAPGKRPLSLPKDAPFSLLAAIEISEQRLSAEASTALRALAVFPSKPNSFSEEAALAVSQAPAEILDVLWDAGLLESNSPGRYCLHQTIADYALVQGLPRKEVSQRLVHFMVQYLHDHAQDYEALELEISPILAALDAAVEFNMQHELITGVSKLIPFMNRCGHYTLADQYLQRAYEAATALHDPLSQMQILQHLAHFAEKRGEYQQAEHSGRQGLALARSLGQLDVQSALLTTLGTVAYNRGDYTQAITYCEQGLELAYQLGAHKRTYTLLHQLAWVASRQGRHAQALTLAQEGLEVARRYADQEGITTLLSSMGQVALYRGDYTQAESFLLEGLALAHQLGYRELLTTLYNDLAVVVYNRGNYQQAEDYFLKGLALARQIGYRARICILLANLGEIAMVRGNYAEAESYLREGVELAHQLKHYETLPLLLANLGEVLGYQGAYVQANIYCEEGVKQARQENSIGFLSSAFVSWGNVHLHFQHLDEATAMYQEVLSLEHAAEMEKITLVSARYGLARVAALRGDITLARQLGQDCLAAFEILGHGKVAEVRKWLDTLNGDAPSSVV